MRSPKELRDVTLPYYKKSPKGKLIEILMETQEENDRLHEEAMQLSRQLRCLEKDLRIAKEIIGDAMIGIERERPRECPDCGSMRKAGEE